MTLSLALRVSSAGDDPVVRKRPGRTTYSNVTLEKSTSSRAQDYNSSHSNNISRSSTGNSNAADQTTAANNYNTPRSNKIQPVPQTFPAGSLEYTDDWIVAQAMAPGGLHVVLTPHDEKSSATDVHSGKLTGVRRHSPVKSSKPVDAATPYIYKTSVDTNGSFVFEDVAPGTYLVYILKDARVSHRGKVTLLK